MPTTIQAAARATTTRKRIDKRDRHRPGYKRPSRMYERPVSFDVSMTVADAFRKFVEAKGATIKKVLTAAMVEIVKTGKLPKILQEPAAPENTRIHGKQRESRPTIQL